MRDVFERAIERVMEEYSIADREQARNEVLGAISA